ncbi:DUF5106 domain-containing protein [Parabacteroides sp. AD58]|uniref:DUF5106 domain-containing protein n=1 Tax=Parabacteroides absconsus TaxID=2951805 RepID=A0ABZ2IP52_9BACT|nr:DUF5106 domain-containing protein [Parabacteroides sp. AD58]MCM6901428.1 DUF5106 domain-containing protein [Parabacteroides sp. AD58]
MNKLLPLLIGIVGHLFISSDLMAQSATNGFTLPAIPDTLQTVESRSSYLVAHYWDRFSFADSLQFMNQPEMVEQAVVDYVDLFRLVPAAEAENSLSALMDQASVTLNGFLFFYNTLEKYLYDATSPMRNEALFIPVLQKMMASNKLSDDDKLRPAMLLKSVSKNKVGSMAADFSYTKPDGSRHRLSELQTPLILLLFFDPECDDCHQVIMRLEKTDVLNLLTADRQLTVLAVYPGENKRLWQTMAQHMLPTWEIGMDESQTIYNKELYDILGFPSMYLLDQHKTVILKDASLTALEEYFGANENTHK